MTYEDKLIDHLSREIETHTKNMMTFRARINFAVFGPFVLLGSIMVSAKGVPRGITPDKRTIVAGISAVDELHPYGVHMRRNRASDVEAM